MAEMQTYGQAEIERYLQHKMSKQEMHEFEKALMNDPFLADALDGFATADTARAKQHISELESAINGDQQTAKVIQLHQVRQSWWKVAAIFLVILSAALVTYSVLKNRTSFNANKQQLSSKIKEVNTERDSIKPIDKPMAGLEVLPQPQTIEPRSTSPIIKHGEGKGVINKTEINDNAKGSSSSLIAAASPIINDQAEFRAGKMRMLRSQLKNDFKGKVVNKEGEPVPFADIKAGNADAATVTDTKGNFSLKASDSVLEININSPGYAAATRQIKSNKTENKIALKDEELSLSEVVLTNNLKKKKNLIASVQVDSSLAAEPVGGWKGFKQYLNQQIDSLKASDADQRFDDDIVLEFSIDKEGHPTNIKTPAELDKLIADKAIKILSNGPRWNSKKRDKKVKVVITF